MTDLPKTLGEAIRLGTTRYFTGKPCKRGHIAERLTSCGRCLECHQVTRHEWFSTPQGKKSKRLWDKKNVHKRRIRSAKRMEAMPPWANKKAIADFYRDCPVGFHVDHIVPLTSEVICGLHIIENMMYLPQRENLQKGNKLDKSMAVGYFCRLRVE